MRHATRKQRFALFTLTGEDFRDRDITFEEADELIKKEIAARRELAKYYVDLWFKAVKEGTTVGTKLDRITWRKPKSMLTATPQVNIPYTGEGRHLINALRRSGNLAKYLIRDTRQGGYTYRVTRHLTQESNFAHAAAVHRTLVDAGIHAWLQEYRDSPIPETETGEEVIPSAEEEEGSEEVEAGGATLPNGDRPAE